MLILNKNVDQIKDALNKNPDKGLVFYAATQLAQQLTVELAKDGIIPFCICDSNSSLHGTNYFGLEVLSIEIAKEVFGDFLIFIANDHFLYEIINQLEKIGIEKKQIINYQPLVKRKGCRYLIGNCVMQDDRVYFCCSDFKRNWEDQPYIVFKGDYDKLAEDFIALRDEIMDQIENDIPNKCSACWRLCDVFVPKDNAIMITSIADSGFNVCNFKCIYCSSPKKHPQTINSWQLVEAFRKKNLITSDAQFQYGNGEITVSPNQSEIYKCMSEFSRNNIFTNALVYVKEISDLMRQGRAFILVSMDAGTSETFAKIKGVDAYERVCDTLRRYAQESEKTIKLKYIFLPDINDNTEDVDGFFELAREIDAYQVFVCSDVTNPNLVNEHTIEMAKYFCDKAKKLSIPFLTSSPIIADALGIYCNN